MSLNPKLTLLLVVLTGVIGTAVAAWIFPSFRDALSTVAVILLVAFGLIQTLVG